VQHNWNCFHFHPNNTNNNNNNSSNLEMALVPAERKGKERVGEKETLSKKAGIEMPVARIYHMMKAMTNDQRISISASVYLAGAANALVRSLINKSLDELKSSNGDRKTKRKRITPRDIMLALDDFPSFAALFPRSLIVVDAGADPSKAADLTEKKKKRKRGEHDEGEKRKRRTKKEKEKEEEKEEKEEKKPRSLTSRRKKKTKHATKKEEKKSLTSRRKKAKK